MPVVRQSLEHDIHVFVMPLQHENGPAAHPVERLADNLPVLGEEVFHVLHIASNERWRATLRKPCRVDFLIHVAQPLGAVDNETALQLCAFENVGAVDVFCVERWVFPHQDGVELTQSLETGFAQREPVVSIRTYSECPPETVCDTVAQGQVALFEVGEMKA